MSLPPRRRRLIDRTLALVLALVVAVIGLLVYRSSDIRNASLAVSPSTAPSGAWAAASVPVATTAVPTALTQRWSATTDPELGTVVSPSGVVVTSSRHEVSAHDAITGLVRWSYTRSNRDLCAVGSADTTPADMGSQATVPGITTVFAENGYCSQVSTFDPVTGARGNDRTSANQPVGSLVFGASYAGWLGPSRVEVWRYDLVRTIQYGDQANPTQPGFSRTGCTFTDMAIAATQFATIEHCPAEGNTARLAINFDDPGGVSGHPDGWDAFKHTVRTCVPAVVKGCVDIDTKAAGARIVGITADRVAVLVSGPTPAVVVYDAAGTETSRTPVDVAAGAIVAADAVSSPARITPAVSTTDQRFSFVGNTVVAVSMPTVQAVAPTTSFSAAPTTTASSSSITSALEPSSAPAQVDVADVKLDWVAADALGLPATVGDNVLLPTAKGLAVFDATNGPSALGVGAARTIAVDRGGYTGRVDAGAVGSMIIEERGTTVVGLR